MIAEVAVPLRPPELVPPRRAGGTAVTVAEVRRRFRVGEIGILAALALAGYLWVAIWTRYSLHFFIYDAISRTADAVYVSVGRDPHVAAIGFYWPPLPQFVQVPFVFVLHQFGSTDMAGPISSAVCVALTIVVLGRICKRLGVGRILTFLICLTFAASPVIVYNAALGMSEACFFLVISIALLGFLSYIDTHGTQDLIVMVVGLCACVMVRFEGLGIVIALSVLAGVEFDRLHPRASLRRSFWNAFVIALPPYFIFVLWMVVQWVLLGDPLFFLHQGGGALHHPAWAPNVSNNPLAAVPWAVQWSLIFGPILLLPLGMVLFRPRSSKTRGNLALLACMGVFVAINCYELIKDTTYGNPRYFEMAAPLATLAAIWLVSNKPSWPARAWNGGLVGLLVVGSMVGSYALTNGKPTHTEGECVFFQRGVGQVLPFLHRDYLPSDPWACGLKPLPDYLASFRQMNAKLDAMLRPTDRVISDNALDPANDLFTRKPNQYIVRNDRDWQKIIADPTGVVTYIVVADEVNVGQENTDAGLSIVQGSPKEWKKIMTYGTGVNGTRTGATIDVYKYIPPRQTTTPNVPQGH